MKENFEAQEYGVEKQKLSRFIYRDNSRGANHKIVFECVAVGILEADEMYKAATGQYPEKQNYIGCSIEDVKKEDLEPD